MGFKKDVEFLGNLPVSEKILISSGPIMVYKTSNCQQENFQDKVEIVHGWSPLLLATAKCFTQIVFFEVEEPICVPIIWKLTVNSTTVQLYTHNPTIPRVKAGDECTITENQISAEEAPDFTTAIANVFMADMREFGETVEMRASCDMIIYNEKIDLIVLKTGSTIIINQITAS